MNTGLVPTDLLCEYRAEPLGIDTLKPRFSWRVDTTERGQFQSAYQILVASTLENIENDYGDMWDSGKVESKESTNVEYLGKKLESGETYYWKVRIWDKYGEVTSFSKVSKFEMGVLSPSDWQGEWITVPIYKPGPSPMFRKEFILDKPIKKARAYISGLGYYELRINGKKVGDYVLDPGWTDYSKRILYTIYDVGGYLKEGLNVVGIILGNGWWGNFPMGMRNLPQVLLQMNIEFTGGDKISIVTSRDSGWLVTLEGPIVENNIYDGEVYDARLEKPGWDTPEYSKNHQEELEKKWEIPLTAEPPGGVMVSQIIEPIRVIQDLKPISITEPKPNIYVYDLGQNIAGWVRLKVSGPKGSKVILKFAELLYEDGTVNQENLVGAKATDMYILKGDGVEIWEPRFTYHGFRYVQVEGFPGIPELENITGRAVRSSVERTGEFECSNTLLNQIYRNIVWTESNNLHSVPTDCPQRKERQGWLNDMTARYEEAIYNFRMANFYPKWLNDIHDEQGDKTGAITDTAPLVYGRRPADPVSSCYLLVPWALYLHYNDKRILEEHYEGMKRWTDYLSSQAKDYIISYSCWGDWASPINECITDSIGSGAVSAVTPGELMSTGYYYFNTLILSKIAHILGNYDDEQKYRGLSEKIREAFNNKFLDQAKNQYAKGSQASHIFPLFLDIVPEENKKGVIENLLKDILEVHNGHLATGNQCTKYLLETLTDLGFVDIAYLIATQTTYPSWGYMIQNGATTVWERWELMTGPGMNSHDHPMYGSIGSWFYKGLAGIKPSEDGPGFTKFIIKPNIPKDLKWVKCSLRTIKGTAISNWEKKEDSLMLEVKIPFNTEARVYIPKLNIKDKKFVIKEGEIEIFKDGKFLNKVEGIINGKEDNEYVIFDIGSGSYSFTLSIVE